MVTGLSLQSVGSSGGSTYIDVAITVNDTGNDPGTWMFPDPTNPGPQLPEIKVDDTTANTTQDVYATKLISSQPLTAGNSGTAVYEFNLGSSQNPGDTYSIALDPTFGNGKYAFHVIGNEDGSQTTAPVCLGDVPPIEGQLPEVPFAAGLPLVGIGVAGFIWYQRKRGMWNRPA